MQDLCLSGSVALNCVANGKILLEGPFKNIWIQPASSDSGGAIGAAMIAFHEYLGKGRIIKEGEDGQKGDLLGPSFSEQEIKPLAQKLDEDEEFSNELTLQMGELGLFGMCLPDKYGGQEMDTLSYRGARTKYDRF